MAKKARKSTARKTSSRKSMPLHHKVVSRIPEEHHDRVIVYGGILAIVLVLVFMQMMG